MRLFCTDPSPSPIHSFFPLIVRESSHFKSLRDCSFDSKLLTSEHNHKSFLFLLLFFNYSFLPTPILSPPPPLLCPSSLPPGGAPPPKEFDELKQPRTPPPPQITTESRAPPNKNQLNAALLPTTNKLKTAPPSDKNKPNAPGLKRKLGGGW